MAASIVHSWITTNELNNRSSKVFQYYSHHLDLFVFWFVACVKVTLTHLYA